MVRERQWTNVRIETQPAFVADVIIQRDSHRNALDEHTLDELTQAISYVTRSCEYRVLTIRGDGGVFCSGADLNWIHRVANESESDMANAGLKLKNFFGAILRCPIPTVAIVHGAVIGVGVGIAAACDFAVSCPKCIFSTPELALGIVPGAFVPILAIKLGLNATSRMLLSADEFSAASAADQGLVSHLASHPDSHVEDARRLASQLTKLSPSAVFLAKRLLHSFADSLLENSNIDIEHLVASWASPDGLEGLASFVEKRSPEWTQRETS